MPVAAAASSHTGVGHVSGEVGEVHAQVALVLLEDDDRPVGAGVDHGDAQLRGDEVGQDRIDRVAQVVDLDRLRPQPLQQAQ